MPIPAILFLPVTINQIANYYDKNQFQFQDNYERLIIIFSFLLFVL